MNTKLKIILVAALILGVTITMGLYLKSAWPPNGAELMSTGIALVVVLVGIGVVASMLHSVKTSQPLEDEMTKRLAHKAGYYAWMATIYIALAVGWFIDDVPDMMPRHGATATMLLSVVTYFIILGVLKIRGNTE